MKCNTHCDHYKATGGGPKGVLSRCLIGNKLWENCDEHSDSKKGENNEPSDNHGTGYWWTD